jgi:hypothetical protein
MTLTPEQKQAVAGWISAGDNLSAVQKKLADEFKLPMTYRDVRFLVDDLNLELKDPAPKVDTRDVSKAQVAKPAEVVPPRAPPEKKGFLEKAKEKFGLAKGAIEETDDQVEVPAEDLEDASAPELAAGPSNITVELDKVSLIPGAIASGSVIFSDGVKAKWIVDQYGRPGFTEVSQPGYRPTPADGQAFMQELSAQLQKRGY